MTPLQRRALGPTAGSLALLLGAFAFQYLGGLQPCHLCLLQRWPHAIAVVLGLLILVWSARGLALLAGLAVLTGAGIAAFHVGVEQHWWPGPTACTAPAAGSATDPGALLDQILATPTVLCDAIAWSWLGISMAGWNALLSAVLAVLWFRAYASSSASQ